MKSNPGPLQRVSGYTLFRTSEGQSSGGLVRTGTDHVRPHPPLKGGGSELVGAMTGSSSGRQRGAGLERYRQDTEDSEIPGRWKE